MAESPRSEDVLRIVGAVQEWARTTFPPPAGGTSGTTCEWCPLCQFVAVLRGERPEITERVTEAGAAVLTAVRSFLDAASGEAAPEGPRIERIDLGD